jgi:hypothetical protein
MAVLKGFLLTEMKRRMDDVAALHEMEERRIKTIQIN